MIKEKYRQSPVFTVSYDWIDVVQRQGYVRYYLARLGTSGTPVLTRNATGTVATHAGSVVEDSDNKTGLSTWTSTSSLSKVGDVDFDIEVKTPVTIKGTAFFTGTIYCADVASNAISTYLIIKLRKWDGASETDLASGTTSTNSGSGTADLARRTATSMDVSSSVKFAIGDTIRVTVEVWADDGGANGPTGFFHDPENISDTGTTGVISTCFVDIPFELDL